MNDGDQIRQREHQPPRRWQHRLNKQMNVSTTTTFLPANKSYPYASHSKEFPVVKFLLAQYSEFDFIIKEARLRKLVEASLWRAKLMEPD